MTRKKYHRLGRSKLEKYMMGMILVIASIAALFPFYWMIVSSLKTRHEFAEYPPTVIPKAITFENYEKVFEVSNIGRFLLNSFFVSVVEAVLMLAVTIPAAYGFYKFKLKHSRFLFLSLFIISSFPFEVVMVYNYRMTIGMGLNNTLIALILPFLFNFYYIYLIYNAFLTIPEHIRVASLLDKASDFKFLRKIALPCVRPTILFVTMLNVISSWNAFVWPMMISNSVVSRTMPLGIYTFISETGSRNELVLAMSVVSEIPVILVFLLFRKKFVSIYQRT